MLGKLFGAVAKAAIRKVADAVADKISESEESSYSVETVRKFQKCLRMKVYSQLMIEVERDYRGADVKGMTPEQRWNRRESTEKILLEHFNDIHKKHFNLKQKLAEVAEKESNDQMYNALPNYERYEELVSASHFEAFVVVVMSEWVKRGKIYLGADDDTETESFAVWHDSIDEAIEHGIVTMDEIESEKL